MLNVYTLDSNLQRRYMFDDYISFIWTERYNSLGDFQVDLMNTDWNRRVWVPGFRVRIMESDRQMIIETVEKHTDAEGRSILTARGRSIESMLENRVARDTNDDLTTRPKWELAGRPHFLARDIYMNICQNGVLSLDDILPTSGFRLPLDQAERIPYPAETITLELEPMTVLEAQESICKAYDMGFSFSQQDWDNPYIRFQIYMGKNRTTAQTTHAPVVFSPYLDNVLNSTTLTTISGAKNVAYVVANEGFEMVFAPGVSAAVSGWRRNLLLVKVTDVPDGYTEAQVSTYLQQKGKEALAEHREVTVFDIGESSDTQYKYNRDYGLGDLVEVRDVDHNQRTMIVTEQIFVSDQEGIREYPTLSELTYIKDQLIDP